MYTHTSIGTSVTQMRPKSKFEEVCLLEIRLRGGDLLLFGCFYRSPTPSSYSDVNNYNLNQLLRVINLKKYSHKCFVEDFNYKDINWNSWSTPHVEDSKEAKFLDAIRDSYLHQHLLEPTRRRGTDEPSLIDLLLTDEEMQVSDIEYHPPLGKSDHSVISFTFNCYLDFSKSKERYLYDNGDYFAMSKELKESNWAVHIFEDDKTSVEEIWTKIKKKVTELRDKYVPLQRSS